jgi:WD40 repeat protein
VLALALSADGRTLASGSEDETIRLWEASTGKPLRTLAGHREAVTALTWQPNISGGRAEDAQRVCLASGDRAGAVHLWDVRRGAIVRLLARAGAEVLCLAFSPDGKFLAAGREDGVISLWDLMSGKQLPPLKGHAAGVTALRFLAGGRSLVSAGGADGTLRRWSVPQGKAVEVLGGLPRPVRALALSPNGATLAAGCGEERSEVWLCRAEALHLPPSGQPFRPRSPELVKP